MAWEAAAIAAGAAILGGASAQSSAAGASTDQRHFTREMWGRQMDAANTAHQRQVKDMRAAGLNPILSAKQGGAKTPSAGNYQTPQYRNIGAEGVQAAAAVSSAQSQQQVAQATTATSEANIRKIETEIRNLDTTNQLDKTKVNQLAQIIANLQLQSDQIVEETQRIRNSAKLIDTQSRGQHLKNEEQQILMDLLDRHEVFKYVKDFGWKGAAAAKAPDIVEEVGKKLIKEGDYGKPGSLFHIKIRKKGTAK